MTARSAPAHSRSGASCLGSLRGKGAGAASLQAPHRGRRKQAPHAGPGSPPSPPPPLPARRGPGSCPLPVRCWAAVHGGEQAPRSGIHTCPETPKPTSHYRSNVESLAKGSIFVTGLDFGSGDLGSSQPITRCVNVVQVRAISLFSGVWGDCLDDPRDHRLVGEHTTGQTPPFLTWNKKPAATVFSLSQCFLLVFIFNDSSARSQRRPAGSESRAGSLPSIPL